ncbi:MAG: hypothetical protein ABSA31_01470 [Acidimicrobiales bacterium]
MSARRKDDRRPAGLETLADDVPRAGPRFLGQRPPDELVVVTA